MSWRSGQPARKLCVPAAGGAGCAGGPARPTLPQRRTSAATDVTSGGTAGPGISAAAARCGSANSPGGPRADSPAAGTSTMLSSTSHRRREEALKNGLSWCPTRPSSTGSSTNCGTSGFTSSALTPSIRPRRHTAERRSGARLRRIRSRAQTRRRRPEQMTAEGCPANPFQRNRPP